MRRNGKKVNGNSDYKAGLQFLREVVLSSPPDPPRKPKRLGYETDEAYDAKLRRYEAGVREYEAGWEAYKTYADDRQGWWARAKGGDK